MFQQFPNVRPALKTLLAILLAAGWLHAAPYGPDGLETEWIQPDGTKLSLRVFGDEFYGRTETLDGYTVVFDEATKSYQYANLSQDRRKFEPSGMKVGKGNPKALGLAKRLDIDPQARRAIAKARFQEWDKVTGNSQRWAELKAERQVYEEAVEQAKSEDGPMPAPPSFTTIGEKVGLTLLIDFSDAVGTIPQAEIINYCNSDNYTGYGNNGSVKKYFQDNSNNLLTYTNTVTAYIRMAQPKTYYNDITVDCGIQGRKLINDAIDILKALPNYNTEILPTFDTLTVDGSNRVVACNVFFAGSSSSKWSYGLWPHSWSLSAAKELSAGGKKVYKYQITNLGTSLTLGTFCHENGHMLCGYPDIYDYDGSSRGGAGGFCLMNSGGHGANPVLINGYFKRASGWTTTTELTSSSNLTGTLTATVGHADYNKIYRYANPAAPTTEYFLFENRQKTGRDANIAASGIAIWHIDQLGSRDNESLISNTSHANYECSLIQADNLWQFQSNTSSGDSKDLYYLGNTAAAYTNTFNDASSPDAKWWSGASSGLNVFNISASGATMTLQFGLPANTIIVAAPNGGEQFYFSSTQNITWLSNTPGNVKIELFKAGALHTVLSASETNDGSYSWLVSPGLPAGNDYTIKISSVATPAYTDSSNAAFSILTQPTLADALDTSGFTWTNSGNANWFAQSATNHDGSDAAQSGAIDHSQNSYMETTLTGPGTLTFWWKVSSETSYDYLRFYLDGTEQTGSLAKISGTVNWVQKTVAITSGNHTVKWGYTKDGSVVSGSDAAWVDQVVYTPSTAPEIAVEQPIGTNLVDGSASVDCGSIAVSGSSGPITFTVKNTGDGNLTGLTLSKDGAHSADFTLGSLAVTTVAPGASTTFTVMFSPSAGGARSAAIHLASNDADENPFDILLTGTGVTVGTLAVSPAGNLTASGSVGGPFSPTSLPYTLSNPGSTSIDWTAAKTAAWMDLDATSGTLAPGANTIVTVSINTTADSLPINSYSDMVTFTNTSNGNGDTTRSVSLDVNPIPAMVTIGDLSQTYSPSTPRSVSVTTDPPGLAYTVTYDGSPTPPTDAGTYAVVATITEPNYIGSDSEDLIIGKAPQIITFTAIPDVTDIDDPFALGATTTSGLPVSYSSSSTAIASVDGNTVTIVGLGTTTLTASQVGNANYAAAIPVSQPLTVVRANPLAIITGDPYKVLIGQSLSLIGSASQSSHGNTITTYGWDLNGDDDYSDATGATPPAIAVADLIGTWGMSQGLNTVLLKVTDSAGKSSSAAATVEIILSLTWDSNNTVANRSDGGGVWTAANQWWDGSANVTWASGSSATFGNTGAGGAVTLTGPTTVNALTFNVFTGTYTLGTAGQAITLNGGMTKNSGSGAVTIISPVILGGAQTWANNSSTNLTASSGSNLIDNGGFDLTIDGTGNSNFGVVSNAAATLTGSGKLIKNGSGRFNVGGVNSGFTGAVTLNSGIMQVYNNNEPMGSGNLILNGGVISWYWGATYTRTLGAGNNQVQIPGGESGFAGSGTTGPTINLGSTVVWGASGEGVATGYFNPGKFVLGDSGTGNAAATTFSSGINLNGVTRTIVVPKGTSSAGNTSTISGVISTSTGTAGLIKEGGGNLTLNQANSYNGGTTIDGGTLTMGNASALGAAGTRNLTFTGNGTLNSTATASLNVLAVNPGITASFGPQNTTFTSTTGSGHITYNGTNNASQILNLGDASAFTGNLRNNIGGTGNVPTKAIAFSSLGDPVGSSMQYGGTDGNSQQSARYLFTGGSGPFIMTNRQVQFFAKPSTGNSFNRAILQNDNANAANKWVIIPDLANTTDRAHIFELRGTNTGDNEFAGAIINSTNGGHALSLNKVDAGKWIISSVLNSYTGATTISGGTLEVRGSIATSSSISNSAALVFNSGDAQSYGNAISGTGTLTKNGAGTLTLTGTNNYTGTTTISGGKLISDGSLSNVDAALTVNSGATLGGRGTIGRNVTIASGGKLEFDISTAPGSHNSLDIAAGRNFGFDGASELIITSLGGATTGTYTLVTGGNHITGIAPATVNLPDGWAASVSISGNSLLIEVTATESRTYTVTYDGNGSDGGAAPVDASSPYDFGSAVTVLGNTGALTKTGHTFAGWNTASDGGGTGLVADATFTIEGDVTLYAQWTPEGGGTFSSWIDGFGLNEADQEFGDDPDGDGINNGLEALFGTDPSTGNPGLALVGLVGQTVTLQHPNADTPLSDVTGAYLWSPDLINWFAANGVEADEGTTVSAIALANTPAANVTTVTCTIGGAASAKLFFRIVATQPSP